MKSLKRRLTLLRRRAIDLAEFLQVVPEDGYERYLNGANERDQLIRDVAFDLMLTIRQFDECRAVHAAYWPFEEQPGPALIEVILKTGRALPDWFQIASEELFRRVAALRMSASDRSDLYEQILGWRELQAAAATLRESELAEVPVEGLNALAKRLEGKFRDLTLDERSALATAVRDYLANQWLYPSVLDKNQTSLGDRYGWLFDIANMKRGKSMFDSDTLESAIAFAELDAELQRSLKRFFDRLQGAIGDYGLESLGDILEEDGSPFMDFPSDWAIIPGSRSGPCPRVVIAIATSKSASSKLGATSVMRKLREVLIGCCDTGCSGKKTEVAIFIGPLQSMTKVIEESSGDIERHLLKKILKVFIPVGVLQKNLNVIAWR